MAKRSMARKVLPSGSQNATAKSPDTVSGALTPLSLKAWSHALNIPC